MPKIHIAILSQYRWAKFAIAAAAMLISHVNANANMMCAQVLTCYKGIKYPTACGPTNGDRSLGACEAICHPNDTSELCKPKLIGLDINFNHLNREFYHVDQSDFGQATRGGLEYQIEKLPGALSGAGLRIRSTNRSDDQWAFVATKIGPEHGVLPNQTYTALLTVSFASKAPKGCAGAGGAPGESVYLKGGVVNKRPTVFYNATPRLKPFPLPGNYFAFNIDKGNQSEIGLEAIDLGNIAVGPVGDCIPQPWQLVQRFGTIRVTSDLQGIVWAYVGTDSAFESTTEIYYDRLMISLHPINAIEVKPDRQELGVQKR